MTMTIGELEQKLLKVFPASDACDWDMTGLTVGKSGDEIKKILIALDPTVRNIQYASKIGANVLLTHHPVFFEPPRHFLDGESPAECDGVAIYRAAAEGVALMNFHTALDFNPLGYERVPRLLGFEPLLVSGGENNDTHPYVLQELGGSTGKNGYGVVCSVAGVGDSGAHSADEHDANIDAPRTANKQGANDQIKTVRDVAKRCHEALGSHVRVYGDLDAPVQHIAWGQGSGNSLVESVVSCIGTLSIDCFITGEIKYNPALDLAHMGIPVILLGHDVSEEPFVDLLFEQTVMTGVPEGAIERKHTINWTTV